MIVPVRCYSCGKPIGQLWEEFKERTNNGEEKKKVMDSLYIERYCCRTVFLGHIDLADTAARFKKY